MESMSPALKAKCRDWLACVPDGHKTILTAFLRAAGVEKGTTLNEVLNITEGQQQQGPKYFMMPKGSCCCSDQDGISTKAECEKAHDALGLSRGRQWTGAARSIPG